MAKAPNPTITVRMNPDDQKLLVVLRKRLGADITHVIRLGLRALAAKEGVALP